MTPRELAAHRSVLNSAREFALGIHANLQASMHNLTRPSPDDWKAVHGSKPYPVFTPDMWMPGYRGTDETEKQSVPKWLQERNRMAQGFQRARMGNPMNQHENQQTVVMIDDRARRAREAKERGEPRDVIDRIMRGVA